MELKYYLRGLGLGIIITAIIMGVAASRSRSMTDAEIIARARQLGMIEGLPLTESVSGKKDTTDGIPKDSDGQEDDLDPNAEQNAGPEPNVDSEQNTDPEPDPERDVTSPQEEENSVPQPPETNSESADTQTAGQEDEQTQNPDQIQPEDVEPVQTPEEQETASSQQVMASADQPMAVTIGSGDGSYEVSQKLADIGAVSSAVAYDTYLCENGYDKKIRAGAHTIPAGANEEQIARIITGME